MRTVLLIILPSVYGVIIHYGWNNYPAIVITIGVSLAILMLHIFLDLLDY